MEDKMVIPMKGSQDELWKDPECGGSVGGPRYSLVSQESRLPVQAFAGVGRVGDTVS